MIRFIHIRQFDEETAAISASGGMTIAYTSTPKDLIYTTALCHTNDPFNYALGRRIATSRLKSPKIKPEVVPLVHPVKQNLLEHIQKNLFSQPIQIFLDDKYRWVSTFETLEEPVNFESEIDEFMALSQQHLG